MDIDQTESGSEQPVAPASTDALGQERRENCSVGLNKLFSPLLRLDESEGQRPVTGELKQAHRRCA